MSSRRNHVLVVALAITLLGSAACGSASTSASRTQSAASPTVSTPSTAALAGTTVNLLTHDSFAVSDKLKADFETETGMTLNVITGGDAGTMVAGAVLTAGAPTADVMFGVDNTLESRAVSAGVFSPYTSPSATALRPELQTDTAGGMLTPIDYGDVCVNIDDEYFAKNSTPPPSSLDDLISPAYKGQLVVEDPGTSSPGLAFLLATIAKYPDGWQDYWSKLKDNDVAVAGSWTDAYTGQFSGGEGKGERPLVVSYATSPPAEIVYASDPKPTAPHTSVLTDGCYRQVEYAGVLAGAANPEGARAVVDWLLSPVVQADVPLSMFVFPAREDTKLPSVFERFAAHVPDPLQLDPQRVGAELTQWLADWDSVMQR